MSFSTPENAAQVYITQIQNRLQELVVQLEEHTRQVADTKAKELFHTSLLVLTELIRVYDGYLQATHSAGAD